MRKFSKEEDDYIRANYLTVPACRMSTVLGRSKAVVPQRMKRLGIVVPPEVTQKFKSGSQLKPGNVPQNKGRKWDDYMSKESQDKIRKSVFQKGNEPHNTKWDLAVTKRIDKSKQPYLFIRLKKANWVPLQRYIWEQSNGPIPASRKIIFKNGNTLDCNLENLDMVTCRELMIRNSSQRFGVEVFKLIQLRGALNRQINKHLKKLSNEK